MSHEEERELLELALRSDLTVEQARIVAFARIPWLDRARASYGFFEAVRAVRDEFSALEPSDIANSGELIQAATKTVEAYDALAGKYGTHEYQSAAREALRSVRPDVHVEGASPSDGGDVLPIEVPLVIGSTELRLEALESKKGNAWYALLSDTGSPLRGGTTVPPDRPGLPDSIRLGDVELELGPAPLWDDEARRFSETEHEPFDVKRLVERDVGLGAHEFRVRVLVSARRDGDWNVTAKLWPREVVPYAEVRDAGRRLATSRPSTTRSDRSPTTHERPGAEGELSANLDLLFDVLKDAAS